MRADGVATVPDPFGLQRGAWERKIGDPWCTQLFFGSGLTIPTSDGTFIPPWSGDNYSSATIENFDEIDAQVLKLLASNKIELVSDTADIADLIVNPVGAANKKDRGVILKEKRFYLDCSRQVNFRLPHYEMRLPGYDDALRRLFPNAWLAKVDLSAAFLHVRIDPRYRRLLGFKWRNSFYRFTHMIFGLSTAPAVWQYAMDRVCDYLRSLGLNIIVYLDDFLLIADSAAQCESQLNIMYAELASLGLNVNHKKTLGPSQSIHYLGLEIDSVKMELRVPDYKLTQVKAQLAAFRADFGTRNSAPLRAVLSLTGRLGHIARAVRSSRPFLRRLWDLCRGFDFGHNLRHRSIPLSNAIWRDLEWWDTLLDRWNGVSRWITGADVISFSDASSKGFGFHCGSSMRLGAWPLSARGRHINWKELRAVELSCAELGPSWTGRHVLFVCDNMTAVEIINSGSSRNPALADIIRRIAMLAALYDFDFRAVHIPGVDNKWADLLSRALESCPAVDWPADYLALLDAPPSSLLFDLASLRLRLASASHSVLSASQSCQGEGGEACGVHKGDLRALRAAVPHMEQLARASGGRDPCGQHRPLLPSVPGRYGGDSPPRSSNDQGRQLGDLKLLQRPVLEDVHGLQGRHARHRSSHGGTTQSEAPIPLSVVASSY